MNFNIDVFNYITGVATLVGLFFQFKDLFPEHREVRKTIVILVTGIFIGTMLSTIKGIKVDIGASVQLADIVIIALVCILMLATTVAIFTTDQVRRNDTYGLLFGGAVLLVGILLFKGLAAVGETNADREQKQINLEEIVQLANTASTHGDYQRALLWLDAAKSRVINDPERSQAIEKRERDVRKKQLGEN